MKRRGPFSHILSVIGRSVIDKFPKMYILANRVNQAFLRGAFGNLTESTVLDFWRSFDFITLKSESYKHLGEEADGGYFLAFPIEQNSEVVSIGLGDNISFDFSVSTFVSRVHMFDHTIERPSSVPKNGIYYDRGLGPKSCDKLLSLADIFRFTDPKNRIVLKVDIEGAEWEVLDSVDMDLFRVVDQFVVEFHGILEIFRNPSQLRRAIRVLNNLSRDFFTININANNWGNAQILAGVVCPDVLEVSYLRKDKAIPLYAEKVSLRGFPNNPNSPRLRLENFGEIFG
jgi:hypothetical protein